MKQIGIAAIQHERVKRVYANQVEVKPYQPTWIVAILPYLEEESLFKRWAIAVGYGLTNPPAPSPTVMREITSNPLALLYCPTRRPVAAYPAQLGQPAVAKTDYALNGGCSAASEDLTMKFPGIWGPSISGLHVSNANDSVAVRPKDIRDGLSKTYLVAEKTIDVDDYTSTRVLTSGDGGSIFDCPRGSCLRFAKRAPSHDSQTIDNCWNCHSFGSAHPSTWNAVFCDGSVHSLSYIISFSTHAALASRAGGDRADRPE